jgi:hypothetical protein
MRLSRLIPALATAALVAGCDSNPTSPTVDVEATLTQMSSGGIATYSGAAASASTSGGMMTSPSIPAANTSNCPYNPATSFFVCAPVTSNGVSFSRSFQLLDSQGKPLSTPSPLLVAAIRSVIDLDGTITPPQGSQSVTTQITRHEDATLSGIQSASRTLNGNATQRLAMSGSGFAFTSNDTSATANLLLPSSPDQRYPLGGTITTNRTVTTSGVTTTSVHQSEEIAFDGTSIMTVKITVGANVRTCKVNLATPGVAPTCS